MEKKCTKCGVVKSLDEFSKKFDTKDFRSNKCKICCKKYYEIKVGRNPFCFNMVLSIFTPTCSFIPINHKKCSVCKVIKILDEFYDQKSCNLGKRPDCKSCFSENTNKEMKKKWQDNNKGKMKEYRKQYRKDNIVEITEKAKIYHQKNKERINNYSKEYSKNNKDIRKKWREDNKEYLRNYKKIYRTENKVKKNKYFKERRENDNLFKIKQNIRGNIKMSLKVKGYSKKTKTYNMLKCEYDFFMEWINGIASNGYQYGFGDLHLDHVVPMSLAQTKDEAILLCHYSNYQLLSADENLLKKDFYVNPTNLKRVLEHHPEPNKIKEIYSRL